MHFIRLHGPWECEPLDSGGRDTPDESLPADCVVTIPADWSETLGVEFRGRVRYTRYFHRPTGLDEGQRVYLLIDRVETTGAATLNGQLVGAVAGTGGPFRFEVSDVLTWRNVLVIDVESLDRPGGITGAVRLAIEE
jgi:beta-galactosidase/beta-glucuronidase